MALQLDLGLDGSDIRDVSPGIGNRTAAVGIAGVNTRPLMRAADPLIGIAGNWGSTLRPHVGRMVDPGASINKTRLRRPGAIHASKRACYFLDYTYIACPDRSSSHMR